MRRLLETVLASRGFSPTDEQRARIAACDSAEPLVAWVERALTAAGPDDVFAGQ